VSVHLGLAWLAGALVALVVVAAMLGRARGKMSRFAIDRLILAAEAAVALAIITGLLEVAGGSLPGDQLHAVYAAVALVGLPIGRGWRGISSGPAPVPLIVAGLVVLGVLVRLAQTG
jgi:hypothetical protein